MGDWAGTQADGSVTPVARSYLPRNGAHRSAPLASRAWSNGQGHDTRALQAYLGHRNIQHTVRYTELSPTRFQRFWRD